MRIYTYNTEPEAQKIKSLLGSQNIPCEIHSFENWGYDGALRLQMGMGEIIVPDELASRAKEIINNFIKEERDKDFEGDTELRIINLEKNIQACKQLPYVIYVFVMILIYFSLFRLNNPIISFMIITLLLVGAILAGSYLKKDLKKSEKELEILKNKKDI